MNRIATLALLVVLVGFVGTVPAVGSPTDAVPDGELSVDPAARGENVTVASGWQRHPDGEAFLDGSAVGAVDPSSLADETPAADNETAGDIAADEANHSSGDVDRRQRDENEDGVTVLGGLISVVCGAVAAFFPRRLARLSERLDAIGSTTPWDEVEPAGWKVTVTRLLGLLLLAIGLAYVVRGVVTG